jgi:hypothetical protein
MDDNRIAIAFPSNELHLNKVVELLNVSKIDDLGFRFIPLSFINTTGEYSKDYDMDLDKEQLYIILEIYSVDKVNQEYIKKWFESEGFEVLGVSETIVYVEWKNGIRFEQVYNGWKNV